MMTKAEADMVKAKGRLLELVAEGERRRALRMERAAKLAELERLTKERRARDAKITEARRRVLGA